MNQVRILGTIMLFMAFWSCSEDNQEVNPKLSTLGKGFFVLNQGSYTLANSSLSFYNTDSAKMTNQVFYRTNKVPLGDVAQSMMIKGNYGYLVVNNSGLIYVIKTFDASFAGKIEGFQSPRHICFVQPDKAYVSDLQLPGIHVVDPVDLQIKGFIETGKSAEQMLVVNEQVFALNWSNYYTPGDNNTLQVIDPIEDRVADSIILAKEPNSMVLDKEGYLWVLCSGGFMNEEHAALFRINTQTLDVEMRMNFQNITDSPFGLTIDNSGETLYFINRDIYSLTINDVSLPEEAFVMAGQRNFYSIGFDPVMKQVIVSDVRNYIVDGQVLMFSNDGTIIDSSKVGIIPGQIIFNY